MPLRPTAINLHLLVGVGLVTLSLAAASLLLWVETFEQVSFLLVLFLFTAAVTSLMVYRWLLGQFDWFEPGIFVGLLYLLLFGYAGLRFVADPDALHPFLQTDQSWLARALFFLLLGVGTFWVGYYGRLGLALHRLTVHPAREWLRSHAVIRRDVVIGLYIIGVLARILMLRQGLYGYLKDPESIATVPYAELLVRLDAFCGYSLILAWLDWYSNPQAPSRRLLALTLLGSEMFWGFFSGMKMNVVLPLLFVAMIYTYKRGRLLVRHVGTAVLLVILIYPVNTLYRRMVTSGELDIRTPMDMVFSSPVLVDELLLQFDDPSLYWESGYQAALQRVSVIQSYALLLKYLDQTGAYWHGRYVWMIPALILVPRAVWPTKPLSNLGYWFAVNVWGQDPHLRSSVAITYPGDLHLQFGLPSLLLGMFLTGIAFRWLYERYGRPCTNYSLFFYLPLFYQLVAHESDLTLKATSVVRTFLILFATSWLVFRFPRRATVPAVAGLESHYRPSPADTQPA